VAFDWLDNIVDNDADVDSANGRTIQKAWTIEMYGG